MRELLLLWIFALVTVFIVTEAQHCVSGQPGCENGPCIRVTVKADPVTAKPAPAVSRLRTHYRRPYMYNSMLDPRVPVVGKVPQVIQQPVYQQRRYYVPRVRLQAPAMRQLAARRRPVHHPPALPVGYASASAYSDANEPIDHPYYDIDILPGTRITVGNGLGRRMKRAFPGMMYPGGRPCIPSCASRLDLDGEHAIQDSRVYRCNHPSLACMCSIA